MASAAFSSPNVSPRPVIPSSVVSSRTTLVMHGLAPCAQISGRVKGTVTTVVWISDTFVMLPPLDER